MTLFNANESGSLWSRALNFWDLSASLPMFYIKEKWMWEALQEFREKRLVNHNLKASELLHLQLEICLIIIYKCLN